MIENTTKIRAKSILFLMIFIFLKVGVAHSLSHAIEHDDANECEHCILVVDSNKTKIFHGPSSSYYDDLIKKETLPEPFILTYKNPLFREHHYFFYFNKPPPSL